MRVSTMNAFSTGVAILQKRQQDMEEAQNRLTSGKRVNHASDDPTAAASAERAMASIGRADAAQRALQTSRNAMTLAEGALGDANELLQQAHETMIAAGNASYSDSERKTLANKLADIRNQLLSIANRPDGAGGYLFSGQGAPQPPFVDMPAGQPTGPTLPLFPNAGVRYLGSGGTIDTQSSEPLPLTVDGNAAWMQAQSGNGYFETESGDRLAVPAVSPSTRAWIDKGSVTDPSALTTSSYSITFSGAGPTLAYSITPSGSGTAVVNASFVPGQAIQLDGMSFTISGTPSNTDQFTIRPSTPSLSVFDALDNAIGDLSTPSRTSQQVQQTVAYGVRDLDSSITRIQAVRAEVGEVMNRTEGVESRISASKLNAQTEKSNAEDLDMVAGVSEFQGQQAGYNAALQAYSMVQRMTLFQYLNM